MAPTGFAVVVLFVVAAVLSGMVLLSVMLVIGLGVALVGTLVRLAVMAVGGLIRILMTGPRARHRTVPVGEPLWRFLDERAPRAA